MRKVLVPMILFSVIPASISCTDTFEADNAIYENEFATDEEETEDKDRNSGVKTTITVG